MPLPNQPPLAPPGRVAMVGVGAFGQFCAEAYGRAGDISVLAAIDPARAGMTLPGRHDLQVHADLAPVLDDPSIEALHIATPPHLRAAIALPALRAGKSVLCEKPLALSLEEADEMLAAARESGSAISCDYVLRHHPAFTLLSVLALSGRFGALRTFSLQNFAQELPADHWMWDQSKSGGILVEHGVHFFDAYGNVAGAPRSVRGLAPRREAVMVTVEYAHGAIGRYFHEFAYPRAVEHAACILFFERGYIEIDGWIPERVHGKLMVAVDEFDPLVRPLEPPVTVRQETEALHFEAQFPDRTRAYGAAIVAGMRDLIARHRDPDHEVVVSGEDARESLALALASRHAVETETVVELNPWAEGARMQQ